jgi:hypothetical protein
MGFDPSRHRNAGGMSGDMGAGGAGCLGLREENSVARARDGCSSREALNRLVPRSLGPGSPQDGTVGSASGHPSHLLRTFYFAIPQSRCIVFRLLKQARKGFWACVNRHVTGLSSLPPQKGSVFEPLHDPTMAAATTTSYNSTVQSQSGRFSII